MPQKTENKNNFCILLLGKSKIQKVKSALALSEASGKIHDFDNHDTIFANLTGISPQLILVDLDNSKLRPLDFIDTVIQYGHYDIIGLTEKNPLNVVVQAVKQGAQEVVNISEDTFSLQKLLTTYYEISRQKDKDFYSRQKRAYDFSNIIGQSQGMKHVFNLVSKITKRKWVTVLVLGETGTGKELIARSIHYNSCQDDEQFVEINCNALPEQLLESELFGHEKGAFTDAKSTKKGLFEVAHGGTLFLDEIGEISQKVQVKLLKALEEKKIRRVGGTKDIRIDTRIISATNRNLQAAIKNGDFRKDLYYRLNVVHIDIPPLRERGNDIIELANYFLTQYAEDYESPLRGFSREAEELLLCYSWPGNVRELQHCIERIVVLSEDNIVSREALEATLDSETPLEMSEKKSSEYLQLEIPANGITLEEGEKFIIENILRKTGGNKRRTCRILQISRPRLDRKIEKYNIQLHSN